MDMVNGVQSLASLNGGSAPTKSAQQYAGESYYNALNCNSINVCADLASTYGNYADSFRTIVAKGLDPATSDSIYLGLAGMYQNSAQIAANNMISLMQAKSASDAYSEAAACNSYQSCTDTAARDSGMASEFGRLAANSSGTQQQLYKAYSLEYSWVSQVAQDNSTCYFQPPPPPPSLLDSDGLPRAVPGSTYRYGSGLYPVIWSAAADPWSVNQIIADDPGSQIVIRRENYKLMRDAIFLGISLFDPAADAVMGDSVVVSGSSVTAGRGISTATGSATESVAVSVPKTISYSSQATVSADQTVTWNGAASQSWNGGAYANSMGRVNTVYMDPDTEDVLLPVYNSAGAARTAQWGASQQGVSLNDTIMNIAGPNPQITYTASGKTLYLNTQTGLQVVYDNAGNYFRVEDTNVTGPLRYTDQFGNPIPNNVPLIKTSGTTQMGLPSDIRNALTHFTNTDK